MNRFLVARALTVTAAVFTLPAQASNTLRATAAYQDLTPGWQQNDWAINTVGQAQVQTAIDRLADQGQRTASASGSVNTDTGALKLYAAARTSGEPGKITYANAGFDLEDTLTASGGGPQTGLRFQLDYDTVMDLSGVTPNAGANPYYPLKSYNLSFDLKVSWLVPNPDYPPGGGSEASPYLVVERVLSGSMGVSWNEAGQPSFGSFLGETDTLGGAVTATRPVVDSQGDGVPPGGLWHGNYLFNVDVPSDTPLTFSWRTEVQSYCNQTSACDAQANGLNSFHLALSPSAGKVVSAEGYRFLGETVPGVPEPGSLALLLVGLALTGLAARRQAGNRR